MELENLCHVKDVMATVVQLETSLRKETGLNLNKAFALCCLSKGPLDAGALADELRIHGASLSRILKTLETQGFIIRDTHDADNRQRVLPLTAKDSAIVITLIRCEQRIFPLTVDRRDHVQISDCRWSRRRCHRRPASAER